MQAICICLTTMRPVVTRDNTIVPENLLTFHKKILYGYGTGHQRNTLFVYEMIYQAQPLDSKGLMVHNFGGLTWESHAEYKFKYILYTYIILLLYIAFPLMSSDLKFNLMSLLTSNNTFLITFCFPSKTNGFD